MRKLRYQALGPLLAGEGSRAFLGLEISNESKARPVVLVFVPEESNKDPSLLARIRRETEHAATLDHPNIVRVYGFATLEEGHARVVEFADGESVRRLLEVTHFLPPRFAAKVAADAAMGVHYAHVAGNDDGAPLLHGDIRPETLMVSFKGAVKASGYGALKVAPADAGGKIVRGRKLHCAPEQVIGGREAMVPQTDVYLLGLTLYECLTGKIPFESAADLDQAILAGLPPPIEDPDIPQALKDVVVRSMAKKAPERYSTPLAFKEAIEAAMTKLPSNEDFAAYLLDFFPQAEERRAARRREIDAGIADFARRHWEANPSAKMPALSAAAIAAALAPPKAPAPPAPVHRPSAPPPPDDYEDDPSPRVEKKSRATAIVIASLALAAVAVMWGVSRGERDQPAAVPAEKAPVVKPAAPLVPAVDAGTPDAGAVAAAPVVDAGAAPKPVDEPAWLELTVEPDMDLAIDGKPAGRSPLRQQLSPGRHVVQLTDKTRGISTSRTVVVRPKGTTSEEISLGKGTLNLSAPEGAVVFLDGARLGYAPIREIPIWEGNHRIVVAVGKAKWEESFYVKAGQPVSFNVHTE